jgi:hypothetical protein
MRNPKPTACEILMNSLLSAREKSCQHGDLQAIERQIGLAGFKLETRAEERGRTRTPEDGNVSCHFSSGGDLPPRGEKKMRVNA